MTGSDLEPVNPVGTVSASSTTDLEVSAGTVRRIGKAIAPETRRAYVRERSAFAVWCSSVGRTHLPATAETFAEYVNHLADLEAAPKRIELAMSAVRTEHREKGHQPPDSRAATLALNGYKRERAEQGRTVHQAPPVTLDLLRAMVETCDVSTRAGRRDRALIVLGFALMGRRSELAAFLTSDLYEVPTGYEVKFRRSKTDQTGQGDVGVLAYGAHEATCPVRNLRSVLEDLREVGLEHGPLFRAIDRNDVIAGMPKFSGRISGLGTERTPPLPLELQGRITGQAVGLILFRAALRAGVVMPGLSAHSLRSGGATEAYRSGADPLAIARGGRWKDGSPVLLGYIRTVDKWRSNPMAKVGL